MEKEKPAVLGKTSYYYKIAVPILMAALVGLLVLLGFAFFWGNQILGAAFFGICGLPGAILLIYLLLPLNAVLYDEKRQMLILRGGRKFIFSAMMRQELPILDIPDIKSIEGEPPGGKYMILGWLLLDTQGHMEGLHITTRKERIRLFTVSNPAAVAKRLQECFKKAKYEQHFKTPTEAVE